MAISTQMKQVMLSQQTLDNLREFFDLLIEHEYNLTTATKVKRKQREIGLVNIYTELFGVRPILPKDLKKRAEEDSDDDTDDLISMKVREMLDDVPVKPVVPLFPPEPPPAKAPPPVANMTVTRKEYYHVQNDAGSRCWDIRIRRERAQGIIHEDQGGPQFHANRDGICNECRETIKVNDMIIIRQVKR